MAAATAPIDATTIVHNLQSLADEFVLQRHERQRRRELDPSDFEAIRQAGFHLACLPVEADGLWVNRAESTRLICTLLRTLARGDASVALVAAMHPAVLTTARWLDRTTAPEPYATAWETQRAWAFQTVRNGAWWGTIISESGTGGDIRKTKAIARRISPLDQEFSVSGDKHFGSGSGITSYVVTAALPDGENEPDIFFMDMRGVPWDGSAGVTLTAAWDGHGMAATQSHAFHFEDFPARRLAWPASSRGQVGALMGTGIAFYGSVVVGIVETAVNTARRQLTHRHPQLGAYEKVEWSRVEMEVWLIVQAYEGLLRAIESDSNVPTTARLAKLAISELAETTLSRICRVIGASSYARHSPFGFWLEDVRALGFLRPPWALTHEALVELVWTAQPANGLA